MRKPTERLKPISTTAEQNPIVQDMPPVATLRDSAAGIARNTSIMMFQQAITMSSTVVLTIFLTRYLGPVEYGRLYLAGSIASIFQIFVNYGGNYLIAKEVARDRERTATIFINAVVLRLILAAVSVAAILAFSFVADYPANVRILFSVFAVGLFLWAVNTSLYACFQGHELLQYTSAGALAERVFISVVAIVALLFGAGPITIAVIMFFGVLANTGIQAWFSKRIFRYQPHFDRRVMLLELREGVPYFLFGVFSTFYYRVGTVLLSKMAPEEVVGWFGGAFRFFESLNFPYFLTLAIYPVLSRSWVQVSDVHRKTVQRSLEYVSLLGVPVSIGAIYFARNIVGIFYGMPRYEPSVIVLQVLAGGLIFLYVDMILGSALLSSDRQRKLVLVSLTAIPLNIILNLLLIPFFQEHNMNGGIGVAVATGSTEIFMMVSMLRMLQRGSLKGLRLDVIVKALAAGVAMIVTAYAVESFGAHWVVAAVSSSLVYVAAVFGMRAFNVSERQLVRELVVDRAIKKILSLWKASGNNSGT